MRKPYLVVGVDLTKLVIALQVLKNCVGDYLRDIKREFFKA
jgi:hypothetical protein